MGTDEGKMLLSSGCERIRCSQSISCVVSSAWIDFFAFRQGPVVHPSSQARGFLFHSNACNHREFRELLDA